MKQTKLFIAVIICLSFASLPMSAGDPPTTPPWTGLFPNGGNRPRTPIIEITCHVQNGLMWFEYDSDAEGCLDITVTQRGTGSSINVVVCDNTPFAVPFNSGILDVSCYTEAGEEYTGTLLL